MFILDMIMAVSFRGTKAFAVNAPVLVGCSKTVGMCFIIV